HHRRRKSQDHQDDRASSRPINAPRRCSGSHRANRGPISPGASPSIRPPSAAWWLPALSSTARSSPSKTLGPPRRLTSGLLPFVGELLTAAPPRPNSRHRGWFEKGAPFSIFFYFRPAKRRACVFASLTSGHPKRPALRAWIKRQVFEHVCQDPAAARAWSNWP